MLAWSGGKDSAWALHVLRSGGGRTGAALHTISIQTFVHDGPMLRDRLRVRPGARTESEGMVCVDLLPG